MRQARPTAPHGTHCQTLPPSCRCGPRNPAPAHSQDPGARLTLKSFHYGRLDDPWYLAHRDDPGGAVPPRIGPEFPTEAWPTLHDFLARVRREPREGMIENDAGIVIPMSSQEMWDLDHRAVPESDSAYDPPERQAFWAVEETPPGATPDTPWVDGQWCLVWRKM